MVLSTHWYLCECFHLTCNKVSVNRFFVTSWQQFLWKKVFLVELNSVFTRMFSFVSSNQYGHWSCDWKSMLYLCYRCSPQSSNNSPSLNSNITGDCYSSRGELRRSHLIIPARLKVEGTGSMYPARSAVFIGQNWWDEEIVFENLKATVEC